MPAQAKPFFIECVEPDEDAARIMEIRISGFLDAHSVVTFEQTVDDLLERGYVRFIVDLEKLNYISSSGIGALMLLLRQSHRRHGDLVLLRPSAKVLKLLGILGFTKVFQITDELVEAERILQQ